MTNNKELVSNVKGYLHELGYEVINDKYYDYVNEWYEWYKSYVEKFHKYTMFNGYKFVDKKRETLSMPKRASEDWASLLFNDNVCITVEESKQPELEELFNSNRFDHKFAELLELTFALGTGATVVYEEKGNPKIDYINALMIFPLEVDNGEIVSCAFASCKDNKYYVNIHECTGTGYNIINKVFSKNGNNYVESKLDIIEQTSSPVKMFQIYKPNITNNIDIFSPYGLSCYANALSQNRACDVDFDSFVNEVDLGKKRIFMKTDLLTYKTIVDEKGNSQEIPIFDTDQTEFYALPNDKDSDDMIREIDMNLRITEHIDAVQTSLNLFSDACGLGPDRFTFKDGKVYTNESQVISTNSKLYKNIKKHEKLLKYSIYELVRALLYSKSKTEYKGEITIDFDDSIIEDTAEIKRQALLELNAGIIDRIQYMIDVYKMTEKQAIEFVKNMEKRSPSEEEPPEEE